jgi:hypothetical protein
MYHFLLQNFSSKGFRRGSVLLDIGRRGFSAGKSWLLME